MSNRKTQRTAYVVPRRTQAIIYIWMNQSRIISYIEVHVCYRAQLQDCPKSNDVGVKRRKYGYVCHVHIAATC